MCTSWGRAKSSCRNGFNTDPPASEGEAERADAHVHGPKANNDAHIMDVHAWVCLCKQCTRRSSSSLIHGTSWCQDLHKGNMDPDSVPWTVSEHEAGDSAEGADEIAEQHVNVLV